MLLCLATHAWAWTYDIYGICNYSPVGVGLFEYDNTPLAHAGPCTDPYNGGGTYKPVSTGGYHHIFQCDHESCFSDNNMRVIQDNQNIPLDGMLATFWTNDDAPNYCIQACGKGITGNDYQIGWEADSQGCWDEGQQNCRDSSNDNYIIRIDLNGSVTFVPGTDESVCQVPLPKPACTDFTPVNGSWVVISTGPVNQTVTFTEGTSHSSTDEKTDSWAHSISATVSGGFEFKAFSASVAVTGELSSSISQSYSDTFSNSKTFTNSQTFPPGVVWQFQFKIQDECGTSTASRVDLQLTANEREPPCCKWALLAACASYSLLQVFPGTLQMRPSLLGTALRIQVGRMQTFAKLLRSYRDSDQTNPMLMSSVKLRPSAQYLSQKTFGCEHRITPKPGFVSTIIKVELFRAR